MIIGTAFGLSNLATIVLSIALAFVFGYALTSYPLLRAGLALAAVVPIALASDTLSIATMEVVDNAIVLLVPGAMDAGLGDLLFWGSLAFALAIAGVVAVPVNRWLIARGKGHAVVHETGIHGGPPIPRGGDDRRAGVPVREHRAGRRGARLGAPAAPQLRRLAEDQPADLGGPRELEPGQPLEQRRQRDVRLEPREVHPHAHVRPGGEREVAAGVLAGRVEAIGVREDRRVAVGGGDRDPHQLAGRDLGPAQLDVSPVA